MFSKPLFDLPIVKLISLHGKYAYELWQSASFSLDLWSLYLYLCRQNYCLGQGGYAHDKVGILWFPCLLGQYTKWMVKHKIPLCIGVSFPDCVGNHSSHSARSVDPLLKWKLQYLETLSSEKSTHSLGMMLEVMSIVLAWECLAHQRRWLTNNVYCKQVS